MFNKCVVCDHTLDEEEYLHKGKSYCDDCYRAVKKAKTGHVYIYAGDSTISNNQFNQEPSKTILSSRLRDLILVITIWENRKEEKTFIDSIIAATIIVITVVATILF